MDTATMLRELKDRRSKLDAAISALENLDGTPIQAPTPKDVSNPPTKSKTHVWTAEQRKAQSNRMKSHWKKGVFAGKTKTKKA